MPQPQVVQDSYLDWIVWFKPIYIWFIFRHGNWKKNFVRNLVLIHRAIQLSKKFSANLKRRWLSSFPRNVFSCWRIRRTREITGSSSKSLSQPITNILAGSASKFKVKPNTVRFIWSNELSLEVAMWALPCCVFQPANACLRMRSLGQKGSKTFENE